MCSRLANEKHFKTLLDGYFRELVRSGSEIYWLGPPRYLHSISREKRFPSEVAVVLHLGQLVPEEELNRVIYSRSTITLEKDSSFKETYRSVNGFTARQLFDIILDFEQSSKLQGDYVIGLSRKDNGNYIILHM